MRTQSIKERLMENGKPFYEEFGDFLADHPEFPEAWKVSAEASIIAEDDGIFGFIFGYLLI